MGSSCEQGFHPTFSRDGRYAIVDRCDAFGNGRIVRLTLDSGQEDLVATFKPSERLGNVNDYDGVAFWAFVVPKVPNAQPSTHVVSDWQLTRVVVQPTDRDVYVTPNGKWFMSAKKDVTDFAFAPLSGNVPPTAVAHGITSPKVTYHVTDNTVLFAPFDSPGSMRRLDLATGALGPFVAQPRYGWDLDDERVFYSRPDSTHPDVRYTIEAVDTSTGVESTLATAYSRPALWVPRGSAHVVYFASDARGAPNVAHTVRADGTEAANTYDGVPMSLTPDRKADFRVEAAGKKIAILGKRSFLLDPESGTSIELPAFSEQVGANFWSKATQTLIDGTTYATIFAAVEPKSSRLERQVAGDGETVWEIRQFECPESEDVKVITHRRGVDTMHGCHALRSSITPGVSVLRRVGTTSKIAIQAPSRVKILSP